MRPPQKTGERDRLIEAIDRSEISFNEAPAKNGGKGVERRRRMAVVLASMRPPQKTGERGA